MTRAEMLAVALRDGNQGIRTGAIGYAFRFKPTLPVIRRTRAKQPPAVEVTTIGVELAKHSFQVHAVDAAGKVIVRKALRRI